LCKIENLGQNKKIQKFTMPCKFVFATFLNEKMFYTKKDAILRVYLRKSLISQLSVGIFQKKIVEKVILMSSIQFKKKISGKTSKF
jgi:hypothetical protein